MEILRTPATVKAPAETFTGDAWLDVIARGEAPSRVRVNVVRFAPGARNAWHAHAVGQGSTSPRASGGSRPVAARSSRSGRATRSTRPRASGTGMARRPTGS